MKHNFSRKTCIRVFYLSMIFSLFASLPSCEDTSTMTVTNSLVAGSENVSFGSGASSTELKLETNIEISELATSVASQGKSWCKATVVDKALTIEVEDNNSEKERTTIVTIVGKSQKQDIIVTQRATGFVKDKLVKVTRVTTTSEMATEHEAKDMIDGDFSTYFNSKSGAITTWPFLFDFYFEKAEKIDYIIHTPRQDSGNKWGAIGKLELWIATESAPELKKYGEYDFGKVLIKPSIITLEQPIEKPTQIQFRIMSGYEDRVSCAEMQFFQKSTEEDYDYLQIFADKSCSEIKEGITEDDLNKIPDLFYKNIALAIFKGTYDKEFRIQEYRPYQHPDIIAKINKTEKYSLKDNATGMYVANAGDELVVFVGDAKGQELTLNIRDYQTNAETSFSLQEGLNVFYPSISGLIYIYNHTQEDIPLLLTTDAEKKKAATKTVKIHIATGEINGYFDIQKHTADDWTRILTNYGKHTEIDILGKHSHITWRTSDYRTNNTDIILMTNYLDAVIKQQNEIMGLFYYKKEFKNRAFIHVDYSAPAAYATSYRTAYSLGYLNVFCTEEGFLSRMWVVGHEIGHVNQTRPGVKWAGTTEVTNNMYAMYNQQQILGDAVRLNTGADSYENAFKAIIQDQQPWILPNDYNKHMLKLPPFWQLKLYFVDILKQEHFYHNLFEHYRVTEDLSQALLGDNYHGMLQLDFVRQVCNTGKMNMIDFFEAWGFLRPVDVVVNDYGNKTMKVTQKQIDNLKAEIVAKNYPKPAIVVQDLTDLNYRQYIR
ncbi:M60 family metallopeptidase [Dysgonomonas sp. HGC4]|uniref:M60 family metallopeptidase n=1 Tax=Dysgonomonas sp. HGC4 TaxID=1658009 RepID=UPI0009E4B7A5|nr:M60 family metallopeptidase [Dysgonomonas sp. HGC4]MBD8349784.1 hypothetical protein [Dysgonomonas sp. HGC4]